MASATAPPRPTGPPAEPSVPPPLALVADIGGKPRVVALSRAAERRGAARGMALAEARALVADLLALPWDGEEVARAALQVTTALLAASPRVAWAGGGTVRPHARTPVRPAERGGEAGLWWVDAAGLGSEAKLAQRLTRLASELGFGRARVGVADSAVAAYAATYRRTDARTSGHSNTRTEGAAAPVRPVVVPSGGDAAFLAPFPLALLEPDEELADTLHALGLSTVGQLAALDADEVESRFGPEGLALHRLARGIDARGPSTPRDDTLPLIACDLGSPVATAEPLLFVLKGALASLGGALRAKGLAAREIALALTLDDGSVAERAVRPARPTSHEAALFDHCRAAFDDWALPEPIVALAVRAAVTVAASGEQGDLLAPRWADPSALEAAFDRIRSSEGADAVATPVERDGHLPGDAGSWTTDGRAGVQAYGRTGGREERGRRPDAGRRASAASRPTGEDRRPRDAAPETTDGSPPGLRERKADAAPPALKLATASDPPAAAALRLLAQPEPIRVRLGRAGLEAFRYGDAWRDVTAWAGPERLVPRWWVPSGTQDGAAPRDYYSARTADGALWLVFRAGAPGRWFVEGWWD